MKEKSGASYWYFRGFVGGFIIYAWFIMMGSVIGFLPKQWEAFYYSLLTILAVPSILLLTTLFIFPWDYSIFGRLEKTHVPTEDPLMDLKYSWGRIGMSNGSWPMFRWRVYRNGLGVTMRPMGSVFIPLEKIELEVKNKRWWEFMALRAYFAGRIEHTSPEVRGPIYMPKQIVEQIRMIKEG